MLRITRFTGGITETNGYFCEADGGGFAVDAPEGMAAWLAATGRSPQDLLLTHAHFDHVKDAAEMQERLGCRIWAWAEPDPELTLERFLGVFDSLLSVRRYRVDQVLRGRESIEICGEHLELLHVPGHSADSVVFYDSVEAAVFGGDVLMEGSVGRTDFPGGSQGLLLGGIAEKLLALPDATRVYPGHGPETTIGRERRHNPFLAGHSYGG
ncbi:MAG TPA: MBL fold metallo-hydrolase [Verrucomicrobiales bacterium]|nr:MBL fold metallo-hydrolase [Verrucomicrobiales bacterium]